MTAEKLHKTKLSRARAIYEEAELMERKAFSATSDAQSEYFKVVDAYVAAKELHDDQEMSRLSKLIESADKSRNLAQIEYLNRGMETQAAREHETNLRYAIEASRKAVEISYQNLVSRRRKRSLANKAAKAAKAAFNEAHKMHFDAVNDYQRLTS